MSESLLPFGKDCANVKRAGDFVADDDAAEGRRENHRRCQLPDAGGNAGTAGLRFARMLQDEGALEISGAVQAGGEPEVPFEQRPDTAKQIQNVFGSGGRHAREYTFCFQANIRRKVIVLLVLTTKDTKTDHQRGTGATR
jgi:hypothetical protein